MSRRKKRGPPRNTDDTPAGGGRQRRYEQEPDWFVGCVVTLACEAADGLRVLARGWWRLVRFVCWDWWADGSTRCPKCQGVGCKACYQPRRAYR